MLARLSREGRSVIVSSHLLSEIEAVCDHLVIVRFGRLVYAGPIADLVRRTQSTIEVRPELDDDRDALRFALQTAGWSVSRQLSVTATPDDAAAINRAAADAGITLSHLTVNQESLEEIFLEMTGDRDHDLAIARATLTDTHTT